MWRWASALHLALLAAALVAAQGQSCTEALLDSGNRTGLLGGYVPQCDAATGKWLPVQCSGGTGYCWCADVNTGVKREGTERRSSKLDCAGAEAKIASPSPSASRSGSAAADGPCAQQLSGTEGAAMQLGGHVSTCNTEGRFTAMQCHRTSGECSHACMPVPTGSISSAHSKLPPPPPTHSSQATAGASTRRQVSRQRCTQSIMRRCLARTRAWLSCSSRPPTPHPHPTHPLPGAPGHLTRPAAPSLLPPQASR
jgi:hypothetical protein